MGKKRVVILGAGLTGLSAAWHLQKNGAETLVFEKEPEAGGLCRSKKLGGFTFDYDGHLLHFKHRYTFELIKDLLKDNLSGHYKSSWIYSCGRYTRYPFQANLYGLPPSIIKECLMGFIEASQDGHKKDTANFLAWINKTFGAGIARHFMVPYNTKFWTVPPEEMSCAWLDGFIPVPSLNQVIEGTIQENKKPLGYNAHFWYPKKGGISQVSSALSQGIKNIFYNSRIVQINPLKKQISIAGGNNKERYDYLISTLPLPEMPHLIKDLAAETQAPFKKLKWNSIFNLNIGIKADDESGRHWIYFPEKELSFFRIGFYNNFSSHLAPPGHTSLYIEVSYSPGQPINKADIICRIEADLKHTGILPSTEKICCRDANDIKYGYPIYDMHYNDAREKIIKYLLRKDIFGAGRYGSWRYFSMEDAILDGKEAAEKVLAL
jgi:protoporphyrinogen oxidase